MARLFSSAAVLLAAALTGLAAAVPYTPRLRTAQFTGRHMQEVCVPSLEWTSEGGEILVNGQPFHLKGTSWFGLETNNEVPHGLWSVTREQIWTFLKDNNFNVVRIPFSAYLALNPDKKVKPNTIETELHDMTAIEIITNIVDTAGDHGILVMLDLHRLNEDMIPEMWYDDKYSMADVKKAWDNLLDVLGGRWNLMGLDLKNEPHGKATWGFGDKKTDWNTAAEELATHILEKHPDYKGLIFVEGTQLAKSTTHKPSKQNRWWGGDLEGVWDNPIELGKPEWNDRVVYSPHVYGPDAFEQDYFKAKDFPKNMPAIWDAQWAFAEEATGRAVVVGEWGGHALGKDKIWQEAFADYLVENCLEDTFYWCLNPNSGDTGGLLDYDFTTPIPHKLKLLDRVQPNPTFITSKGEGQLCIAPGAYVNPKCDKGRRLVRA